MARVIPILIALGIVAPTLVAAAGRGVRQASDRHLALHSGHLLPSAPLQPPTQATEALSAAALGEKKEEVEATHVAPPTLQQQHQQLRQHTLLSWLTAPAVRAQQGVAVFLGRYHLKRGSPRIVRDPSEDPWAYWGQVFAGLGLWIVCLLTAAVVYKYMYPTQVVDISSAKDLFKDQDFQAHPFMCHEVPTTCLWGFLCGGVRWSDTVSSLGFMSYVAALGAFIVVEFFDTIASYVLWLLVALFFAYYRQQIRTTLNLKNDNLDKVKDLGMWCCCQCCAIVQEARQINSAPKMQLMEDNENPQA